MRPTILTCAILLLGAANVAQAAEKGKPLDDAQCKAAYYRIAAWRRHLQRQASAVHNRFYYGRYEQRRGHPTSSKRAARPVG